MISDRKFKGENSCWVGHCWCLRANSRYPVSCFSLHLYQGSFGVLSEPVGFEEEKGKRL